MHAVLLGTYILSAASITSAVPYEDDPLFLRYQLADNLREVDEVLFVRKQSRNPILGNANRCQAMTNVVQADEDMLGNSVCILSYKGSTNGVEAFITTPTTARTAPHRRPNTLVYATWKDGPRLPLKVMFADTDAGCFILVRSSATFGRGCLLLQTNSTVDKAIPEDCERVYMQNCPRRSVEIYDSFCRDLHSDHIS